MAKELKGVHSLIGQALAPDFSKEEDPGDALFTHMQYISPLLRGIRIASDLNNEGSLDDVNQLLELFEDCFEKGLEEFEECSMNMRKNNAAAKVPVAKIGKARKAA